MLHWLNWCELCLTTVKDHVPMRQVRGNCTHPWIDSELLSLIRKKEKQRKKARVTDKPEENSPIPAASSRNKKTNCAEKEGA